jgi:hypothetical protein
MFFTDFQIQSLQTQVRRLSTQIALLQEKDKGNLTQGEKTIAELNEEETLRKLSNSQKFQETEEQFVRSAKFFASIPRDELKKKEGIL